MSRVRSPGNRAVRRERGSRRLRLILVLLIVFIVGFVAYRLASAPPATPPTGQKTLSLTPPPVASSPAPAGTSPLQTISDRSSIEIQPLPPVPGTKPTGPPPAPPPPLPKPPPGWYLQVAAYYGRDSARPLVHKMRAAGFRTWYSPTIYHERQYMRIWVGPYRSRRSAYPHMARITAVAGTAPFWVRVGHSHGG